MTNLAYYAAVAGLLYGALRYALVWLLPFLLAWAAAAAAEPAVRALRRRLHLKRSFLSAVFTLLSVALLTAAAVWLLSALWRQLTDLLGQAPQLLSSLPELFAQMTARLESYRVTLPPQARQAMSDALTALGESLSSAAVSASAALLERATKLLGQLPGAALFCITLVMALFFTVSTYPQLRDFLHRQVPEEARAVLGTVKEGAGLTAAKWLRAQLLLITVTFSQLLLGLLLLRRPYALLFAALIALLDALPLFGAGLILLPWAALLALLGDTVTALGLAALYVLVWLVRSFLEPKLLGQIGDLPPLPTLMAIYLGFRIFGVAGMIAAPLLLLVVKALHDRHVLRLWK